MNEALSRDAFQKGISTPDGINQGLQGVKVLLWSDKAQDDNLQTKIQLVGWANLIADQVTHNLASSENYS